jgi:hypothetical protein
MEETIGSLIMKRQLGDQAFTTGSQLHVPTAGLAMLDADTDRWREVKAGRCVLRWFLVPKLVKKTAN